MFKDRLLQLRKNFGVTQGEVAKACGVSTMAVCKWERGDSNPDLDNMMKLADYFHVSMDHLSDRAYVAEDEVRLMSRAMYQLNPEERKRMVSVAQAMYADAFENAMRTEGMDPDTFSEEN